MKSTTLCFPSIMALIDFQMITQTQRFQINTASQTLSGPFTEAAIELAKAGFQAEVVEVSYSNDFNQ